MTRTEEEKAIDRAFLRCFRLPLIFGLVGVLLVFTYLALMVTVVPNPLGIMGTVVACAVGSAVASAIATYFSVRRWSRWRSSERTLP